MSSDPLEQRRELANRVTDTPEETEWEDLLYGSQSTDWQVGGETVLITDEETLPEDVQAAIASENILTVPTKVQVRNRGDPPLKVRSQYFPERDYLAVDVQQPSLPTLSWVEAQKAWVRHWGLRLLRDEGLRHWLVMLSIMLLILAMITGVLVIFGGFL